MTVSVKWDADAAITGLPDQGTNSKQYPTTATSGTVTVTDEQNPGRTRTVTFDLPLTSGGEETVTPNKTSLDSAGDATERTITVAGEGFPASTAGTVALHPGAPGSGGTAVVTANITTDATGAFTGAAVVVPPAQAAGAYHIVVTVAAVVHDATAITVTNTPVPALAPDKTTVDSTGDVTARTVTVTGTAFAASTAGTVALHPGAPGSGGTAIVTANATTTAAGAIPSTTLEVPLNQIAGTYHLVATFGATSSDDDALAVTGGAGPAMSVPANLAAGTETATTIPLTWDAVTTPVAAESYVVRHAPTGTTTWTERAPVTAATDTITGLTASTGYDIQVKAEAAEHTDSAWSATLTATTTA